MDHEPLAASTEDVFDYYASPTESLRRERILADREARESVESLFWSWERRRIVYNAVLVAVALFMGSRRLIEGDGQFYATLILGAFLANVFYCTGFPLIVYIRRLGIDGRATSLVLFTLGTLLAMFLTCLVCLELP